MEAKPQKAYVRPEDVSAAQAEKILAFLNAAKTPEEIAQAVEFPGKRDVGITVAQNILGKREELGTFKTLKEVADVRQVGPERFTDIVKAIGGMEVPPKPEIEVERAQFRSLILKNPNYFGNVRVSPFKPVKAMKNNTAYEEMACVGFNPQFNRLEAVVLVKRGYGYGGDVCSSGTPEYVRFYADWNNDGTWTDLGMTQFTAYDIPDDKPLEYGVSLTIDSARKWCGIENLPKVRAILSWNNPPPANDPSFTPVWGNVLEAYIQTGTLKLMPIGTLMEVLEAKLPIVLQPAVDMMHEVPLLEPKTLSLAELAELYKDKGVPEHRFGFTHVQKLMAKPALTAELMAPGYAGVLAELKMDISSLIEALLVTDGDTRYEELKCVGLNPNRDTLMGILTVKLPCGYSGDLCKKGSYEYVAFWEWDEIEQMWLYLGTTVVNVHDISSIPPEGLQYAVLLPVDMSRHRQPCTAGPRVVKIRAILSWETPPPPDNPNWVPTWGNREETLVHIKPGPKVEPNTAYVDTAGNMAVCDIDQDTGLATGTGIIAAFTANESPFGGTIAITGFILNSPNVLAGANPFKYRVSVRECLNEATDTWGPWQPLANTFTITITKQDGIGMPVQYHHLQSIDPADGYYTYHEQNYTNQWVEVAGNVLAKWQTAMAMNGLWELKLEAKKFDGTPLPTGILACIDGTTRSSLKLRLDNLAPEVPDEPSGEAGFRIIGYRMPSDPPGVPTFPATDCGTFPKGCIIIGKYTGEDTHFYDLRLWVAPSGPAHGATPTPSVVSYSGLGDTGVAPGAVWELDTSPMDPCGYIVHLQVRDRAIINSGWLHHYTYRSVGFCMVAPVS